MDTGTHIVMGFGLAGLSALDPVVSHQAMTSEAVLLGVVFGSIIPDIDTVLKLKANANYLRNHRGLTHSIPATILWPVFITGALSLFFDQANLLHLWLWTFLAVFLHVFVDIFNAYGTQALRPLTFKWVALGIISIFDPVIFTIHIAGFILWFFIGHQGVTFLSIYIFLIGYYLLRIFHHHLALSVVRRNIDNSTAIFLSPRMRWSRYHVAVKSPHFYYVGELVGGRLTILDRFDRATIPTHPAIKAAKKDENIKAFLSFSPIYRFEFEDKGDLYEIRFIDLRYLKKGHYPFVAIARVNKKMEVRASFTGWIYNKKKLEKRLSFPHDFL